MMLRELEAFEACWLDLKDVYPTSSQDNMLIAHSMGQLVDLTTRPDQVERDLPGHLKILFRRLALAYFQGYIPTRGKQVSAALASLPTALPSPDGETRQRQDISTAVDQVKALAKKNQARLCKKRGQAASCALSDMETLIIEFPEHWQVAT